MNRLSLLMVVGVLFAAGNAMAHCEIPCGIYDDEGEIGSLHQDIETIAKSIDQIKALSAEDTPNYNQIVRWVNNKDEHAEEIQEKVQHYFLTQRIKPVAEGAEGYEKYIRELTLLHELLINAMKAKQNVDVQYTNKLHETLEAFEKSYLKD